MISLLIVAGLAGLVAGGEVLVRGASRLAAAASVPPLVIGLTVVAFGTSAPELAVSIQACLADGNKSDLAVGNAVGSNIANVLLILGFTAMFFPLSVHSRLFKLDIPVMIAAAFALWALGLDHTLSRYDGALLTVAMFVYFWWTVKQGRRESRALTEEFEGILPVEDSATTGGIGWGVVQFLVGLSLLVLGSNWLVEGCSKLAELWGWSELVIGLTVVAVGTSMPELVTSIVASLRGHRDLAVGNVVGSNILNVLTVLGITSTVAPSGVIVDPRALAFDIPIMIAVSVACLPVLLTGLTVQRTEGAVLFLLYCAYTGYLVYAAIGDHTPTSTTALMFSLPLLVASALVAVISIGRLRQRG